MLQIDLTLQTRKFEVIHYSRKVLQYHQLYIYPRFGTTYLCEPYYLLIFVRIFKFGWRKADIDFLSMIR